MRVTSVVVVSLSAICAFAASSALRAGDDAPAAKPGPAKPDAKTPPAAIQWFATWEQGAAEAKRAGRPILLVAAAPHCHEISGLW